MKNHFIKFLDKIMLSLLGFSGMFYGCVKYGMPETEYIINGTVTNKTNSKPIEGIRIVRQIYENSGDTLYTNPQGKYVFKFWNYDYSNPVNFKIEDIDGEENGGEFASQEIEVKFTQTDQVEKGDEKKWYRGKFTKTQNIELDKKQ